MIDYVEGNSGGTWPWYVNTSSATVTGIVREYTLPVAREFHTWREALLQALDAASMFNTVGKPCVRWRYDRWLLTYNSRPTLMNGAVA